MAITFTNGSPASPSTPSKKPLPGKPPLHGKPSQGKKPEEEESNDPRMKAIERQEKTLQRQKDLLTKQLKLKKPVASLLRDIVAELTQTQLEVSDTTTPDSSDLYQQIQQLLGPMGIKNEVIRNKITLVPNVTKKANSRIAVEPMHLYKVPLRRETEINDTTIDKLKLTEDTFDSLEWTAQGPVLYMWAPYNPERS
jgi:hypothetical protein